MSTVLIEDADDYFTEERLNADAWHDNPSSQQAALNMAENFLGIVATLDFTNENHKKAVYEQALFELQHSAGADKRAALQAMGVESAGIVQEVYRKTGVFICVFAAQALQASLINPSAIVLTRKVERNDCATS